MMPSLYRLAERKGDLVLAAEVSHGGHARAQRGSDRLDAAHQQGGVALGGHVAVGVGLRAAMDVGVHLDEAGHDAATAHLDDVGLLAGREIQAVHVADLGDPAVLD